MIRRSTQQIGVIAKTMGIAENNPQIRRRGDPSDALMMEKSGVRSIVPHDMTWKSARLFWIAKRCCHQQCQHPKNPTEVSISEVIKMMMSQWGRST
jgi:hypothetical protein